MKVLVLATEDYLGAGKAAFRIYEALKENGHQTCFIVKTKTITNDPNIYSYDELVSFKNESLLSSFFKRVRRVFYKKVETNSEFYFFGRDDNKVQSDINLFVKNLPFLPELIIATWISRFFNQKMLYILSSKTGAKVVHFPLDMSLLTGGCHYAWDCTGYMTNCNNCPAIISKSDKKIASNNLKNKLKYIKRMDSVIIASTEQLMNQINLSALFKNKPKYKILLPIDAKTFNNESRSFAKGLLNIGVQKKVIFFGAAYSNERRKGVNIFISILSRLNKMLSIEEREKISVLIVGKHSDNNQFKKLIPFEVYSFDYISNDKKLSCFYQASDVFVTTSIQDSGPMMVNEAVMCGTPVVMHNIGVASDLLMDGISGRKIEIGNEDDFANAILYFLNLKSNNNIDYNLIARKAQSKTSYMKFSDNFNTFLLENTKL